MTQRARIKNWQTTAIAVALFAALAVYVLLTGNRHEAATDQEPTPAPIPLLDLNIADVQSLRIISNAPTPDSSRAAELVIAHTEREWRLSAPETSAWRGEACLVTPEGCVADPYIIHLAVDALCHLEAERALLEETSNPGQYGLDPVSLILRITMRNGEQDEIHIGRQTSDRMSYYTQRAGDPRLYLVAQHTLQPFFEWLKAPPTQPTPAPD